MSATLKEFLTVVCGTDDDGDIRVAAGHPDTGQMINKFCHTVKDVEKFISKYRKTHNLYFTPTRFKNGFKREHAVSNRVFRVDMDDIDYSGATQENKRATLLSQLKAFPLEPTFSVLTGGGVQAYWAVEKLGPDKFDYSEEVNYGLAEKLGADKCWDLPRLLRIPGTVNYPNKRKRDRGRTTLEVPMPENGGPVYSSDSFCPYVKSLPQRGDNEELGDKLPDRPKSLDAALINSSWLNDRFVGTSYTKKKDGSLDRSENDWAVAQALKELGIDKKEIAASLFYFDYGKAPDRGWPYVKGIIDKLYPVPKVNSSVSLDLQTALAPVKEHYKALTPTVEFMLAVVGCLCFSDLCHCIAVMVCGQSGTGKTTALKFIEPIKKELGKYFKRVDDFTPKSFVSHAMGLTEKQLKNNDLLPKLKDKVMLSGEMSPIFRGSEDELISNFKVLTPILDGRGYVKQSGAHGTRGYEEDIQFNWIGCTTPLEYRANKVMNNLGTRIVFFQMEHEKFTEQSLRRYCFDDNEKDKFDACKSSVNVFVESLFKKFPPRSIPSDDIIITSKFTDYMCKAALFLVSYRSDTLVYNSRKFGGEDEYKTPREESPIRVMKIVRDICKGHALINGLSELGDRQIDLARKIMISSAPEDRRLALEVLLQGNGICSIKDLQDKKKMSHGTAKSRLEDLVLLDIVESGKLDDGTGVTGTTGYYRIMDVWHDLFNLSAVTALIKGKDKGELVMEKTY